MATTKLWSIEEVAALPDDGFRYALIRGVLYRMPPPMGRPGRGVLVIGTYPYQFVTEHDFGVVYDQSGFILERDPDTLVGPDLSFVQSAHVPTDEDAYPEVAPDLVVEVASPSQTGSSIEEKTDSYLETGVRLVWAVDPGRRTIRVRRPDGTDRLLTERDEFDGEDILPGVHLSVAQLFR